jgi:RNA polymerase sigma-70 factor (ECF subfamily)
LCRNTDRADDLVQEAVVKALANLHRFEPGTNLRAWLFTILRNTYYTDVRIAGREVADVDGSHTARLASVPEQMGHLAFQDLHVALQKLPVQQREVLLLVGAQGLSYEETARICGVAIGTIKSRVCRAREQLAVLMGEAHTSEIGHDSLTLAALNKAA